MTPDITVEIELYCTKCGAGICNSGTERSSRYSKRAPGFDIEPCSKCMSDAESKGYDDGYEKGYAQGKNDYEVIE